MGFLNSSHHSGDSYYLIKAASKAYAEEQEQKRKQREGIQPAAQRLRHAAQQQFYLENKRRMGYKDSSKKKDPYIDPPHESNSNHDSNVNKSKPQAQSKSTYQPSMSRTTTKTMDDPPPYDPSPQAQSQSTHQPSTSRTTTKTMDDPPPYDQSPPCEMQVDGKAGSGNCGNCYLRLPIFSTSLLHLTYIYHKFGWLCQAIGLVKIAPSPKEGEMAAQNVDAKKSK
ncbi:hypothetical protein ACN42_g5637 [Penicillium freii]|uniref:Uncharacterized protein n=1 Tax=Penicillium freii TaxID=48697 RepID=A0A101MJ22_PENFR|nr:hypothetical protein ACN42_g5637 [Penicillium freii]